LGPGPRVCAARVAGCAASRGSWLVPVASIGSIGPKGSFDVEWNSPLGPIGVVGDPLGPIDGGRDVQLGPRGHALDRSQRVVRRRVE
jgi:hypothetical protein